MVIIEYKIISMVSPELINFLNSQPNLVIWESNQSGEIKCTYDHDTVQQRNFKIALGKINTKVNGTQENINRFIEEFQTDQLLYMTDRQVIKTNIGATFVNLFTDFNGRPFFADFTGFTRIAFQTYWTKIGTGAQHLRIIDDSGVITSDLINTENLGGGNGLVTSDNPLPNFDIPAPYANFIGKLRIQVRSTVAADDPVFEGMNIYLRR